MSDEPKSDEPNLEEKLEQEKEQQNSQLQRLMQMIDSRRAKSTAGAKVLATSAVLGYLTWRGLKSMFWPPKVKKYLQVAVAVTAFYGATHPAKTVNFVKSTANNIYQEVGDLVTKRREVDKVINQKKELEKEISEQEKQSELLQKRIEEETGVKVQFKNNYEKTLIEIKTKDQFINNLKNDNYMQNREIKTYQDKLKEKEASKEITPRAYAPPEEEGLYEPDRPIGGRANQIISAPTRPMRQYESKTPVIFVQRRGTTLAEIARQFTGDSSNWRELAVYNHKYISGNSVIIYLGEKIEIPSKHAESSKEMKWLTKSEMPNTYFMKEKGETMGEAMRRNLVESWREKEVLDYNRKLMPSIRLDEQEIFWVPARK